MSDLLPFPTDDTGEAQIQAYYARLATAAEPFDPVPADLWARVAPFLSSRDTGQSVSLKGSVMSVDESAPFPSEASGARAHRSFFSVAAALLVVVLIASVVVFARQPRGPSASLVVPHPSTATPNPFDVGPTRSYCGHGTSVADYTPLPPVVIPTGGTATDKGITIHIDKVFADATHTVIYYSVTTDGIIARPNMQFDPLFQALITDENGRGYQSFDGGFPNGGLTPTQTDFTGLFLTAAPFAPADLGQPQTLTLTVTRFTFRELLPTPGPQPITALAGLWQVRVPVTPVVPRTTTYHLAPIVHCGVAVRPLSLDVTSGGYPSLNGFIPPGGNGGARLELEISGLPAQTQLSDIASGWGTTSSSPLSLDGLGPARENIPGFVFIPATSQPGVVGPSGTVRLDVILYQPLHPKGKTISLAISTLYLGADVTVAGPWHFDLPVN